MADYSVILYMEVKIMKNLSDFGARVKKRRIELGITQTELAKRAGYTSRSTINKIELGLIDVPQSKIVAIARALMIDPTALVGWESPAPELSFANILPIARQRIPLFGRVACGEPIFASEDRESYVEAGTAVKADFCLQCQGDSMIGARILDGDIVFIQRQDMVENGQIAAVIIGEAATLKRVFYYPEKGKLVLQAENPKYEPLVYVGDELNEIRIIGKAVAFQSDVK